MLEELHPTYGIGEKHAASHFLNFGIDLKYRFSWHPYLMNWARSTTTLCALRHYNKAYHSHGMPDITQQSMHGLEWQNCEGHSQSVQWHNADPHKDNAWKPRRSYDSCVWQIAKAKRSQAGILKSSNALRTYWPTTTVNIKPTQKETRIPR